MFSKVLAVVFFLAAAYCQEHAQTYSLKSIVKHEEPKKVETYHSIPVQTYHSIHAAPSHEIQGGQSYGHAVSSQSIIRHDSGHHQEQSYGDAHQYILPIHHSPAPVKEAIIEAAPIRQIQYSGHGHAVSSQSIIRHDSHQGGQQEGHQGGNSGHYFVAAPIQTVSYHAAPVHQVESQSHGHAVSSQSIIRHDDHNSQSSQGSEHGHYIISGQHHAAPVHHTVSLQAAPIEHHYVQSGHQEESHHEEYYAHPKYEFEYKIEDPHTGDNKFQHEARDGDKVEGVYSLHEADGSIRTVKYSADKHNGFNAQVSNSGVSKHIEAQAYHH